MVGYTRARARARVCVCMCVCVCVSVTITKTEKQFVKQFVIASDTPGGFSFLGCLTSPQCAKYISGIYN